MSPLLISSLFELAGRFYRLANAETERLSFDDYANLQEWEAKLNAYGNLLAATSAEAFLKQEISEAKELLAYVEYRLGAPRK